MSVIVLDTSALIAFVENEKGADRVQEILDPRSGSSNHMHAANAIELLYQIARKSDGKKAKEVLELFVALGVTIRQDMDAHFQKRCYTLKTAFPALSLGDSMTISLAQGLGATVLTSDKEFSRAKQVVNVEQIR